MKKLAIVALVLTVLAGYAMADLESYAVCRVRVEVDPNVAVRPVELFVDAGSVQTGEFTAMCLFRVDANKQMVNLSAEASNLYKGDDPTNDDVAPIPLVLSEGILCTPDILACWPAKRKPFLVCSVRNNHPHQFNPTNVSSCGFFVTELGPEHPEVYCLAKKRAIVSDNLEALGTLLLLGSGRPPLIGHCRSMAANRHGACGHDIHAPRPIQRHGFHVMVPRVAAEEKRRGCRTEMRRRHVGIQEEARHGRNLSTAGFGTNRRG